MTRLRSAGLVIAVAILAAVAGYQLRPQPAAIMPAVSSGDAVERLFALKLSDLMGKEHSLAEWRGKVLVVNFWATWCTPCREEIPEFSRISQKFAGENVQFVGVALDTADKVAAFTREVSIPYPTLLGSLDSIDLLGELGNTAKGLPFTLILGSDGTIHHLKLGVLPGAQLEEQLNLALAATLPQVRQQARQQTPN